MFQSREILYTLSNIRQKTELLRDIGLEKLDFLTRKIPTSDCFPFEIHFPPSIPDAPEFSDRFYFIGRNWLESPEKPIAIAFGFNDWKWGFIAEYFPE